MSEEVIKKQADDERKWICAMGLLALLVTLFPLACPYLMEGGKIQEWLVRVQQSRLFLDAEVLSDAGMPFSALQSGLFCLPFSLIYKITGNPVLAYRIFMLLLQVGTFCSALLMFRKLFAKEDNRRGVFWGVVFYITNPCRIAVCYDAADLALAVVMMLVPIVIYAVVDLKNEMDWKAILAGALALAGIGYADGALFWVVLAGLLLVCLITGNLRGLLTVPPALLLFTGGIVRTIHYLFGNDFLKLGIDTQPIAANGYYPGELFLFFHAPGKLPGMGAGLFMALLAGAWLLLVENAHEEKENRIFWGIVVVGATMSLKYFPWNYVEHIGEWASRLVTFFQTPVVFWALAQICLCVPAAQSMVQMGRKKEKIQGICLPLLIYIVCVALTVWQCNTLTYERLPLL